MGGVLEEEDAFYVIELSSPADSVTWPAPSNQSLPSFSLSHGTVHLLITSVVLGFIILSTIFGNVFVVAAIILERNLRNVANYLIASLAVADLMVAALVMPLAAVNEVSARWFLGSELCEAWTAFDMLCCTASILHLVAISLDRYWAVTRVDYIHNRSARRILVMIAASWSVSALISVPPLVGHRDPRRGPDVTGVCQINQDRKTAVFSTVGAFYLPLVAMMIIYARVYRAARSRIRKHNFAKQKTIQLRKKEEDGCRRWKNTKSRGVRRLSRRGDIDDDDDDETSASIPLTEYASTTAVSTPPVTPSRRWCHSELAAIRVVLRTFNGGTHRGGGGGNGSALAADSASSIVVVGDRTFVVKPPPTTTTESQMAHGGGPDSSSDKTSTFHGEVETAKLNRDIAGRDQAVQTWSPAANGCSDEGVRPASRTSLTPCGKDDVVLSFPSLSLSYRRLEGAGGRRSIVDMTPIAPSASDENPISTSASRQRRFTTAGSTATGIGSTGDERPLSRTPSKRIVAKRAAAAAVEAAAAAVAAANSLASCVDPGKINGSANVAVPVSGHLQWSPPIDGSGVVGLSPATSSPSWKARDGQAAAREKLKQKRERKAARTLAIVTGTFVVCWLPFFIVALIQPFFDGEDSDGELPGYPSELRSVIAWLGYINSLLNPAIYTVFNPDFRSAFRKILFGRCRTRFSGGNHHHRQHKQQQQCYQRAVVCEST